MTQEFIQLLTTDPEAAKAYIRSDMASSGWMKQAITELSRRDPTDVLFELDILLNLFEAICDHLLGFTPNPHCRVRRISEADPGEDKDEPLDQFPGEIEIGGTLDRLLVPDLLAILQGASVCLSWESELFAPASESELLQALDAKHHLHFYNQFALEGEFPSLEDWLIEHQLPFRRISKGSALYQAERLEFRKGLSVPQRMPVDGSGNGLIPRDELRTVFRYLKEGRPDDANVLLEHVMGVSLQPLPPFEVRETLHGGESDTIAQLT
jgi:hypothetical protein